MVSQIDFITNDFESEVLKVKLSINNIKGGVNGNVVVYKFIDKDTKQYVVYIPSLEISGYGEIESKAIEMLKFSLEDFSEYLSSLPENMINAELLKLGWKKTTFLKEYSHDYELSKGKLNDINAENGIIERFTLRAA